MNWRWITRPHPDELVKLPDSLCDRIIRLLEWRGLLIADPEHPALDLEVGSYQDQIQAASVQYRIAIGPHAGRKALTLYNVPPVDEAPNNPLLARLAAQALVATRRWNALAAASWPPANRFRNFFALTHIMVLICCEAYTACQQQLALSRPPIIILFW